MSTWFMNAPLPLLPLAKSRQCMIIFHENNVELSYLSFKTRALKCYVWNLFHESRKNKAVYISSTVRMQFSRHCMIYLMLYVHNAKSIPDSLKLERIDEICNNKCFPEGELLNFWLLTHHFIRWYTLFFSVPFPHHSQTFIEDVARPPKEPLYVFFSLHMQLILRAQGERDAYIIYVDAR